MNGFHENIEDLTETNTDFRRILHTGEHLQVAVMSLEPGQDLGEEVYSDSDQFFCFEKGKGEIRIEGATRKVGGDDAVLVPAGERHNIINTGSKPLRFFTIYGPPNHPEGLVQKEKPGLPEKIGSPSTMATH